MREHLFGDLEGIHALHGPGEAHAHLEHLARAGVVSDTAAGYRLASTTEPGRYRGDAAEWPLA